MTDKSPAEIEAEIYGEYRHSKLVRGDPVYRLEYRVEFLEDNLLPPLAPLHIVGQEETDRPQDVVAPVEPQWSRKQWDYVQLLIKRVNDLESKLNEHLDKPKGKRKEYPVKAIDL